MELEYYTKKQVHDLPLDVIKEMNKRWRLAIKEHYHLWTYEMLKRNPRPFDEFLLDQEELEGLHYQFRWETITAEERMMAKFGSKQQSKNKNFDVDYFDNPYYV